MLGFYICFWACSSWIFAATSTVHPNRILTRVCCKASCVLGKATCSCLSGFYLVLTVVFFYLNFVTLMPAFSALLRQLYEICSVTHILIGKPLKKLIWMLLNITWKEMQGCWIFLHQFHSMYRRARIKGYFTCFVSSFLVFIDSVCFPQKRKVIYIVLFSLSSKLILQVYLRMSVYCIK